MDETGAKSGPIESYNHHGGRRLSEGVDRLYNADKVIFHHGLGYDLLALEKIMGPCGFDPTKVIDTLVLSRLGKPMRKGGHSLEAWGDRLGFPKLEHYDWAQWSPAMERRCNGDVEITRLVFQRLRGMLETMPIAVRNEHRVAWEVALSNRRGMVLDTQEAITVGNEMIAEKEELSAALYAAFPPMYVPVKPDAPVKVFKRPPNRNHPLHGQIEGGVPFCPITLEEFNPGSRQQLARRLKLKGWTPTVFTEGGGPKVSDEVLQEVDIPEAQLAAKYLKLDKLSGFIMSAPKKGGSGGGWLHHVKDDGRLYPNLNPCGTVTGRPSCASPNLQQVPKRDPVYGKRMRGCFPAPEGYVMVGIDASSLELRCLGHYLQPLDDGAYIKEVISGDVHTKAMMIIGFYDRDQTKRGEYGYIYGAGDARLGIIALQDAHQAGKPIRYKVLGLPDNINGRPPSNSMVGGAIRRKLEMEIAGLGELVAGVKYKARKTGKLRGIDGRTLWVRAEHSAFNFILQSAGAVIMKVALSLAQERLRAQLVEDRDFAFILWVHDEFQYYAKPEVAQLVGETVAQAIRDAGDVLGFRCPLDAEFNIGTTWAGTH